MNKSLDANTIISNILRWSSMASIVFMTVGLLLYLFHVQLFVSSVLVMKLGILILLLTPFLRVLGTFFVFLFVDRDIKYAVISIVVFMILIAGAFVPGLRG